MGNITLSRRVGIISQGREGGNRVTVHQKLNRCFLTIVIYRRGEGRGRIFIVLD